MKIRKALRKAIEKKCCLTREAWRDCYNGHMKIWPTDTGGGDIRFMIAGRIKASGWEPDAGDILAKDWILVKK